MIELVVVIVILAVLAAVALPRILDLGDQARATSITALSDAIRGASNVVHAKCLVEPTCDEAAATSAVTIDGLSLSTIHGYPDAGDAIAGGQIDQALVHSGYSVTIAGGNRHVFTKAGGPSAINCSVTYQEPASAGAPPQITVTTSGC